MIDNRKRLVPTLLVGIGVFLLIITVAWKFSRQTATPTSLPTLDSNSTPTPDSVEQIQRVDLPEAKAAFDAGSALFLDVRGNSSYSASHIPGAVDMSLGDLATRFSDLDPSAWIIPYCT
jgi:Rhodanese-like domain